MLQLLYRQLFETHNFFWLQPPYLEYICNNIEICCTQIVMLHCFLFLCRVLIDITVFCVSYIVSKEFIRVGIMGEIDTKPIESVQTALSIFGENGDQRKKPTNWNRCKIYLHR